MEPQNQQTDIRRKKRNAIFIGLGIAATGIAGYFGWQYLQRKKAAQADDEFYSSTTNTTNTAVNTKTSGGYTKPAAPRVTDSFPLKKGSRGPNVKALQDALVAQYGASILPKYGADGDFGSETVAALKKAGLPATIDLTTFNILSQQTKADPEKLAAELFQAVRAKNFSAAMAALGKIHSKEEYSTVSAIFQERYRLNLVRQTLVNGMLNAFTDENQKQQIRLAFSRIGLSYDGSKWSLSGLGGYSLITTSATRVWSDPKTSIDVPALLVLGSEVERQGDYTAFENGGRIFLVPSGHVRYV